VPPTDRFVAETSLRVRYAETDAMGIVHHASYIVYLELGRTDYARQRGSDYASFERSGYYLAVTEVNARYSKPAHYDDLLIVRCWLEEMKSRGLAFGYEILNAQSGDLHVSGQTRHVCITRHGRVAVIPEQWRAWGNSR
jgi:acyl-CoA thioester hydrolase